MNSLTKVDIKPTLFYLYINTVDNTPIILTEDLEDLFVRTFINMGSPAMFIDKSYIVTDLQIKAALLNNGEFHYIDNLNWQSN